MDHSACLKPCNLQIEHFRPDFTTDVESIDCVIDRNTEVHHQARIGNCEIT